MKKSDLKKIIAECIIESIQENPDLANEGFFKNMFGDPKTSGQKDYEEFAKRHNAGADVHSMKNQFEKRIIDVLKDGFKMGDKAGMDRKEVAKLFRSSITSVFNKYKTLEEWAE